MRQCPETKHLVIFSLVKKLKKSDMQVSLLFFVRLMTQFSTGPIT